MRLQPFATPDEIRDMVERGLSSRPLVHPTHVVQRLAAERPAAARANGWLADHIVAVAGTMAFFYFLGALIGAWALWQSAFAGNHGFDPYPYSFLFFILGGIMQSLFVPTMLVASNRAEERDRIKAEVDHRANEHLYAVNDEQLAILKELRERVTRLEAATLEVSPVDGPQ